MSERGRSRSKQGARARSLAALAVDQVLVGGRVLDRAFDDVLPEDLPERERSQVKALSFGALRWHHRHQLVIGQLLERPLRKRDKVLEALLSVGLYELTDERQPGYAVVSANVEATRLLGRPRASGLINAALRRFQRESTVLLETAMQHDAGRFAHPRWLIDQLRSDWPEEWERTLTAALEPPPMWLRVNRGRVDRADYAAQLTEATGVGVELPDRFPDALRLDRPLSVSELPGFADGEVSVQDAAAQLAAELLSPEPGMRVLDACAAPGGKTVHLLERAAGHLDLVALDMDAKRNAMVHDNLRRAGFEAEVIAADARDPKVWATGRRFERILVDAPCSATGVIRRHPDIKFLRRQSDIGAFAERQYEILEALWPLLEPGGRLLYATCSILRAENDAVVSKFLDAHADAVEVTLEGAAGHAGPGLQLLPGPEDTDGFYYALMARTA
jgi:16S rRNA (cytosine967-C5)-methyltransferase